MRKDRMIHPRFPYGTIIGILAGDGELPWIGARSVLKAGYEVRIYNYSATEPPEDLKPYCRIVVITKLFSSVLKAIQKDGVQHLLLLGKATRQILFENPSFDVKTLWHLTRMRSRSDYSIFDTFSREFEKGGVTILPQNSFLGEFFLPPGRYGKKITNDELADISFGMHHVVEINRLDIGQTLVAAGRSVLAVEAAEGTDACIRRGGELARKKGAVVCKVGKRNHDERFDMPVTGEDTLESMEKSGCRVLAIESSRTFVLHPRDFLESARSRGISVLSLDPEKSDLETLKKISTRAARLSV